MRNPVSLPSRRSRSLGNQTGQVKFEYKWKVQWELENKPPTLLGGRRKEGF